jgi:hypothetical protein
MQYSAVAPVNLSDNQQLVVIACAAREMSRSMQANPRVSAAFTALSDACGAVLSAYAPPIEEPKVVRQSKRIKAIKAAQDESEPVDVDIKKQMGGKTIVSLNARGEQIG